MAVVYLAFCWLAWDRTLIPDEIWALTNAERFWREQFDSIRADLVHPPLGYVLQRAWISLFGLSDFTAKSLPVVINLLAISLFPLLAVRITKSWRLASLLFLTVYLHVFSTPNLARMYGLVLLLTVASILAWDRWRSRPTIGALLGWATIMSLAVMTHFFGALLLASFVLITWWTGPKPKSVTIVAIVPALLFCAWVSYVFPVYAARGLEANVSWVEPSLIRSMAIVPFHFLTTIPSGWNPVQADWWAALPGKPLLVVAAAAAPMLLVAFASAKKGALLYQSDWLIPLAILICVPALMLAAASLLVGPAFHSRFLLGSLPAYWLLMVALSDLGGKPGAIFVTAVILPAALLSVFLPLHHDLAKSPLREAVNHVAQHHRPGDAALADHPTGAQAFWELRRAGLSMPIAFLPATEYFRAFALQLPFPDRAWVFCDGKCNSAIMHPVEEHAPVEQYGRYLTLFERR